MTNSTLRSSSVISKGNNGHWIEEDTVEFEESKGGAQQETGMFLSRNPQ